MNLWQPKMRQEETDDEYFERVYNHSEHIYGRRYTTPEIIKWIISNKINVVRDYKDSKDIRFIFRDPEEEVLFRLKFG